MTQERYEHQCGRCGSSITFEDCWNCGGEDYSGHDCGDDSCCCDMEDDNMECEECGGNGCHAFCLASEEWCKAHPMPGREKTERHTVEGFLVGAESKSVKKMEGLG